MKWNGNLLRKGEKEEKEKEQAKAGPADKADANPNVHIHRGSLGDVDPTGGTSDLDSTVHRWLNPVIRVVVTVR